MPRRRIDASEAGRDGGAPDRLRRARVLPLLWLASAALTSLLMPGIGLLREERTVWVVLGAAGVSAFVLAQTGVLVAALSSADGRAARRPWGTLFLGVSAATMPLVGPVAAGEWATSAWVGAGVVGTVPIVLRPLASAGAALAAVATGVAVAAATGGSPWQAASVIGLAGGGLALVIASPVRLWRLVEDAHAGRDAVAALAIARERLRFARDVHDSLGHALTVIGLQAELIERGHDSDATDARAGTIRRLATTALADVRGALAQMREADLGTELLALRQALEGSGVRCALDVDPAVALAAPRQQAVLAAVAREAVTNVLRHSRADVCTLSVASDGIEHTLVVRNDGVPLSPRHDPVSGGLLGARERAREVGGHLMVERQGSWFEVRVTVGAP